MVKIEGHIAVLDDDESVRKSLRRLLKSFGYKAHTFANPLEFLLSLDDETPQSLILDMRMPGMNGLELQQELLSRHITIPLIFISAHDDEETRKLALARGAVAFLYKPFDENLIIETIRSTLKDIIC